MNNIIKFAQSKKSNDDSYAEACTWLARLDAGISSEDRVLLESWLSQDPKKAEILLEMAVLWDQLSVLSELSDVYPLNKKKNREKSLYKNIFATAAAILFCFLSISMYVLVGNDTSRMEFSTLGYETDIGRQKTVSLPDGSKILLNTNTKLEINFTKSERRVVLVQGESLFTVATDFSRPFKVYAGNHVIEAVGTSFTVQRKENDNVVEVLVTEGQVSFGKLPESIELNAISNISDDLLLPDFQRLSITAGEFASTDTLNNDALQKISVEPEEIEIRLAWQNGMLLFLNDPLDKVLEEVSRYTTIRIEAEESTQGILVRGYFRTGDIDGMLVALERNFRIKADHINESYIRLSLN